MVKYLRVFSLQGVIIYGYNLKDLHKQLIFLSEDQDDGSFGVPGKTHFAFAVKLGDPLLPLFPKVYPPDIFF